MCHPILRKHRTNAETFAIEWPLSWKEFLNVTGDSWADWEALYLEGIFWPLNMRGRASIQEREVDLSTTIRPDTE